MSHTSPIPTGFKSQCHATTRVATVRQNRLILLQSYRSKRSYSAGLFCWNAQNVSGFGEPYAFTQTVIDFNSDDSLTVQILETRSAFELPLLTTDQLKSPNLLSENAELRNFVQEELVRASSQSGWVSSRPKAYVSKQNFLKIRD